MAHWKYEIRSRLWSVPHWCPVFGWYLSISGCSCNVSAFLSFQLLGKVAVILPVHLCFMLPLLPFYSYGLWCKWNFLVTSLWDRHGLFKNIKRHLDQGADWHGEGGHFWTNFTNKDLPFIQNTEKCRCQLIGQVGPVCVHLFCFILFPPGYCFKESCHCKRLTLHIKQDLNLRN